MSETIVLSDSDDEPQLSLAQRLAHKRGADTPTALQPLSTTRQKVVPPAAEKRSATKKMSTKRQSCDDSEEECVPIGSTSRSRAASSARASRAKYKEEVSVNGGPESDIEEFMPSALPPSKRSKAGGRADAPTAAAAASSSGSSSTAAVAVAREPDIAPIENRKRVAPRGSAASASTAVAAYLKARAADVKKRSFPLSAITTGVVPCARTVKAINQWSGMWPPIREFLQNTIDHLDLLVNGRLNPALVLERSDDATTGAAIVTFRLAEAGAGGRGLPETTDAVCTIRVPSADELIIEQQFTYPLHPRALDTGVNDTSKSAKGSRSAGGFGDGFKTAMVALLALPGGACRELLWDFFAEGRHISWRFRGADREAVGAFAKATVMEVAITNKAAAEACGADGGADGGGRSNAMVQRYRVKGIGAAFLAEAVPRLVVFWPMNEEDTGAAGSASDGLSTRHGDMLCPASSLPVIPCAAPLGAASSAGFLSSLVTAASNLGRYARRPEPGIYIRGIWVRKPTVPDTVMSYLSGKLNVSGRDRNDVDADELLDATLAVLGQCDERATLRRLLEPLRRPSLPGTWLTKPGASRFVNQLLAADPDFFRHTVLGIAKGSLFVSKRTTESKEPFLKWASAFLAQRGAPLVALEPKANRHLFSEASEEELEERCVAELLQLAKTGGGAAAGAGAQAEMTQKAVDTLMGHLRLRGKMRVHISSEVAIPFVHGGHAFVPTQPPTRALLIRLLGVVQRKLGVYDENFTHLQQALFEALPGPADREIGDLGELDTVIERAKQVKQEAAAFLHGRSQKAAEKEQPGLQGGKGKQRAVEAMHEDGEVQVVDGGGRRGGGSGGRSGGGSSSGQPNGNDKGGVAGNARGALEEQIARSMRQRSSAADLGGGGFAADGADSAEECIKPASALIEVCVCEGAGGGSILADGGSRGLLGGEMGTGKQAQLMLARRALEKAKSLVVAAVPSLKRIVDETIKAAWDGANGEYAGFCAGGSIVINLAPMVKPLPQGRGLPRDAAHELTLTVCHELAHLLERGGDHGQKWRATQDSLVQAVLLHVAGEGLEQGEGKEGAGAFAGIGGCRCCK